MTVSYLPTQRYQLPCSLARARRNLKFRERFLPTDRLANDRASLQQCGETYFVTVYDIPTDLPTDLVLMTVLPSTMRCTLKLY